MSAQTLPIAQHRPEDLVFVSQTNELVTDSLLVAKYFSKRHEQVLRKLKALDCSSIFSQHNFVLAHYHDAQDKVRPKYQMTKDGFMFLVMGFTGKKAAVIKEAYINAFNIMAEKLQSSQSTHPTQFDPNLYKDFVDLKQHVNFRVLIEITEGRPSGFKFIDNDAFVCTKSRIIELMGDKIAFTNQEIIKINSIAAKRLMSM